MKRNILITGFDTALNEAIAKEIADSLSMYFLSLPDLTLYYANRPSKQVILKEGGNKLYDKYVNLAVKDAVEFESMVAAGDFTDFKSSQLEALKETSLIVFLGESYKTLIGHGVKITKAVADYSRYKYSYGYDIFINADCMGKSKLAEEVLSRIVAFYGG